MWKLLTMHFILNVGGITVHLNGKVQILLCIKKETLRTQKLKYSKMLNHSFRTKILRYLLVAFDKTLRQNITFNTKNLFLSFVTNKMEQTRNLLFELLWKIQELSMSLLKFIQ